MVDRSLGIRSYASVTSLVLFDDTIEMQSPIHILNVFGKLFAIAFFYPSYSGNGRSLSFARYFDGRVKFEFLVDGWW